MTAFSTPRLPVLAFRILAPLDKGGLSAPRLPVAQHAEQDSACVSQWTAAGYSRKCASSEAGASPPLHNPLPRSRAACACRAVFVVCLWCPPALRKCASSEAGASPPLHNPLPRSRAACACRAVFVVCWWCPPAFGVPLLGDVRAHVHGAPFAAQKPLSGRHCPGMTGRPHLGCWSAPCSGAVTRRNA